jgi:3-oxoacyl-[acyl-carrier protein] reductase
MDNVVVTGASRGIGLAIARKLAAEGYRTIAVARSPTKELDAAIEEASARGVGAICFETFDLADIKAIPAFAQSLRRRHGPIYALVNNAATGAEGLLATMPDKEIEALLHLNCLSPIILTKYVVRGMMSEGRGRVVNLASIVASTGYNGLAAYGATKASMIGFTKSLAREVGKLGITVNAVAPGFIDTAMTQGLAGDQRKRIADRSALRRLADVEDIAEMTAFLIGESGRNITGAVMTVDAGGTA